MSVSLEKLSNSPEKVSDLPENLSSSYGLSCPKLDSCVSRWERVEVEKILHIYYHDDFVGNDTGVYRDRIHIGEFNDDQRQYYEKVKGYLSKIDARIATAHKIRNDPEKFRTVLDEIKNRLVNEEEPLCKWRMVKFIKLLYDHIRKTRICKGPYEGSYIKLLSGFAEMCCLYPEFSFCQDDHSVWNNLYGIDEVVSKPDIRLFKLGVNVNPEEFTTSPMLVSVLEVKKDSPRDSRNDPDGIELQMRRLDSTCSHSSASCDSLASSDDEGSKPMLANCLSKRVLGQHAGDLLLDLHQCHRSMEGSNLVMSGMIIDETMVYLTVLEISNSHFRKLERNQELDLHDKATIYYTKPLDIMYDDEREILMEILIRLNNIEHRARNT